MKKLKITFSYVLGGVVLLGVVALAGSLSPSAPVGTTMKTMEDVYQKLTLNTYTPLTEHDMSTTSSPFPSMHSLADIWDIIPTIQSDTIATGTTIMGITGTLYGDTDPSKVLTTATYPGTATAGTPALEWSADLGPMTWDDAIAACANNGFTGIPSTHELMVAISSSFLGGGFPGGFVDGVSYWSGDGADWFGSPVNYTGAGNYGVEGGPSSIGVGIANPSIDLASVRCVR